MSGLAEVHCLDLLEVWVKIGLKLMALKIGIKVIGYLSLYDTRGLKFYPYQMTVLMDYWILFHEEIIDK